MKKFFTLAFALLAALTMNAQSTAFLWQYDGSSVYGDGTTNGIFDVAADATNGTVKFVTYEAKKTSADGTSAYDDSVTDNDLKPNITKVCKLGNNGAHLRISPASGNFLAGDTLFICGYKDYIISTSSDPTTTAKITSADAGAVIIAAALATGSGKGSCKVGYVVLPENFVETNEIYISRANGTSAGVAAIKVVRPETKTVVSTEETITAITVNGDSLSAAQIAMINDRNEDYGVFHAQAYATAPTVVFSRHTVITYDDESTKVKDEDIEVVAEYFNVEFSGEFWRAALVGTDKTFKVDMSVAASAVITYMDGETVLGRDTIAAGSKAVNYAKYEVKPLAAFGGWYNDAALTDPVDLSVQTFNADATVYGKFTKAYASSLNIEQLVLDEGTKADIKAILAAKGYAYENIDALDTLNDLENKNNRNYAYLGLKLKTSGAYVACNIKAGDTITVKFGNVGADLKIGVNGEYRTLAKADAVLLGYKATADSYLEIITTSTSTVVLQQIMVNEPVAEVTLPDPSAYLVTCAEAENGKVEATWPNKKYRTPVGETVTLTVTPNDGYKVTDVQVDGVSLNAVENVYSFTMPAKDVEIVATFESEGTAIDDTEATVKAVKVIRNGQIFILRDGKEFNILGTQTK